MIVILGVGIPVAYLAIGYFLGKGIFLWKGRRWESEEWNQLDWEDAKLLGGITVFLWPLMIPIILVVTFWTRIADSWDLNMIHQRALKPRKVRDFINEPRRRR